MTKLWASKLLDCSGVAVLCFASMVYMCEAELADHDQALEIQNRTWTFLDSFLWSLMTITTVGQENNPSATNAQNNSLCMTENSCDLVASGALDIHEV